MLRRSHVFPEFVYKPLYDSTGRSIAASGAVGDSARVSKVQRGWYERLLCDDCEQFLNRHFEQPSVSSWRTLSGEELDPKIKIEPSADSEGTKGLVFKGLAYQTLKLFLLSLLWRAGVAEHEQFAQVRLGDKHERELRRRLLDRDPGEQLDYPCFFHVGAGDWKDWRIVGPPIRFRFKEHWCYRLVLTRVVLTVIVSGHFRQYGAQPLALSPSGELRAGWIELSDLPELRQVGKLLREVPLEVMRRYGLD